MPKLDIVGQIFHTTTTGEPVKIVKVYRGSEEVWPRRPVDFTLQSTKWDAVTITVTPPAIGATSYVIKRDNVEIHRRTVPNPTVGFTFTDTWPTGPTGNPAYLLPGTEYEYTVEAHKAGGMFSSAKKKVTTAARRNMTITTNPTRWDTVEVGWTDPETGDSGKNISYDLHKDKKSFTTATYSEAKKKPAEWLNPNQSYNFEVFAVRLNLATNKNIVIGATGGKTQTTPVLSAPLTCTAVSASQINLSWTNPGGLTGITVQNITAGSHADLAGTATTYQSTSLAANKKYTYRLDGTAGANTWTNIGSNSATTHRATKQSTATCGVLWWASYNKNGIRPTNSDGSTISNMYYGYAGTTHGQQSNLVRFDIPAAVRNCISIDSVELSWWNKHTWEGGGTNILIRGHHWVDKPGTPGGTSSIRWSNQTERLFYAPPAGNTSGGWITSTQWINLMSGCQMSWDGQWWSTQEAIRTGGIQGFGIVATSGTTTGYGYASIDPVLRIKYTHYV